MHAVRLKSNCINGKFHGYNEKQNFALKTEFPVEFPKTDLRMVLCSVFVDNFGDRCRNMSMK